MPKTKSKQHSQKFLKNSWTIAAIPTSRMFYPWNGKSLEKCEGTSLEIHRQNKWPQTLTRKDHQKEWVSEIWALQTLWTSQWKKESDRDLWTIAICSKENQNPF